ncbi:MAG: hypothetical protein MUE81_02850 [Thermoflexibacter sp.]|nr:hypothetical protein [Thermoflexibacter sp.]
MGKKKQKLAKDNPLLSEEVKAHPLLKGFYVRINAFGEIERSHSIDEINQFLNQNVVDSKLKHRFGYKTDAEDDTISFMYGDQIS